ncbi:hypothetical protein CLU79DRAFT_741175 [Phycomyces nitens]|nr:hypothetical protein CLU79DRAFT_741175 [Phycomyces nitens]
MPYPSRRQLHARRMLQNGPRFSKIKNVNETPLSELNVDKPDTRLEDSSPTVIEQSTALTWKKGSGKDIPGTYKKNSATTMWRRRKAKELLAENAKKNHRLEGLRFFRIDPENTPAQESVPTVSPERQLQETEEDLIRPAYEKICNYISQQIKLPPSSCISMYEMTRYQAVKIYFLQRIQGFKKVEASEKATELVYDQINTYLPKTIRRWAREYIAIGSINSRQQGKHKRRHSLLEDEAIPHPTSN